MTNCCGCDAAGRTVVERGTAMAYAPPMLRILAIVTVGLGLGLAHPAQADSTEDQVLALINQYRATAGVPPVVIDAALGKGCREHARYMMLNRDKPQLQGLAAHKQDPSLPGATPAGAACAKAADLFPGVSDLRTAVHGWMASLYHRRPMLSPRLERIAIGYALLPDKTMMAALMFVDAKAPDDGKGWPVGYPANGQRDVPLEFGNEIPNPIPSNGHGGYPFTLQFPPFDEVTRVTASLVDGAGKAVPFHLSTPEKPATSFGQYGVICLIPKAPLRPDTRYTAMVKATWRGQAKTWTWGYRTVGLRTIDATDEANLLGALGQPSLVRGVVQHGGMMNTETAYLTLDAAKKGTYEMVSVVVPIDVWRALSKAAPEAMKGTAVEVEATPQLVQNRYLNLPISTAAQLRFVGRPKR